MPFLLIAELLGYENYIPSFATASGQDILKGVNNASAAAGIRSESGQQMVTYLYPLASQSCLLYIYIYIYIYIERERERERERES